MENGNEKHNKVVNQSTSVGSKQQTGQWRTICGADQRFYFVNLKTKTSHWLPPPEFWSSNLGLPYGWEAGINENSSKYYINHVNQSSTLEDPRSEADQATHLQMATPRSRKVQIKRDPSMGFGFVAGSEKPVVIRSVISGGPSYGRLYSNDQILKVNGTDVSSVAQERVINLIKSCVNELEMHVVSSEDLQDAKNQGKRRSSLMSRATREKRRSSPVNVRFADDIVQYIGPAEQARRGSLPVIPNVLKVFLENGQTRSFHFNNKTIIQEIFTSLGHKLDIKAMEHFSLILSGPQRNQLSFIQNHEKVSEVYLNRNCSRASWVCKLRICFLPRDTNELLEKDPVSFDYLYDQITKDVVEGLFEVDLRYDLAIRLAALHMQQRATEAKRKVPTKLSVKNIEKDFGGLEHFIPENIINGVKLKDLRKVLEQQIKLNQSLSGLGQRYLTSNECKQQYLKLANDLVSYGGKYFNVILFSNNGGTSGKSRKAKQQEAAVLVSPKYGLSQMVKGKINVLCQLADLEQVSGFSISFHAEGKRLLKISVNDNKDTILLVKPLDSMDLVTFIIGYQKLWKTTVAMLTIEGETQEPLAPITDTDIPPYETIHRVFADSWSYPSLLQVPGSNSEHNFYVDLSKEPPKYSTSNKKSEKVSTSDENSSIPVDNNNVAVKRSSDSIANQDDDGEGVSQDMVPEKRPKVDGSISSDDLEEYNPSDAEDLTVESAKGRTLYVIAEEGREPIIQDEEEDYISQLALAEEMWRRDSKEEKVTLTDVLSNDDDDAQDTSGTFSNVDINSDDESMDIAGEISINESPDVAKGNVPSLDDASEICDTKSDSSEEQIETRTNELARTSDDADEKESSDESTSDSLTTGNMDVVLDEDSEGTPCLDINDIEFDDRSAEPASDSLFLLADFSFMGESITRVDESSAVGVGSLRGDASLGDVKDGIDSGELLHPNTSAVSSSSDQNDEHFTKNYLQKFETSESVESNEPDDHFNSSGEIIFENSSENLPFETLHNLTKNENAEEFDTGIPNVNVEVDSSRSGGMLTTRNSDEDILNNDENEVKDAEKNNRTSADEDSTYRIRLDSSGSSGGYPVCLSQKAAAQDSDSNEEKDAETDSTTGSSKDSDLSSLTSHEGSLQLVCVNADTHEDDVVDKDIPNTDLFSVGEHNLNLAEQCRDEKMRLENLTGSNLPETLEESLHHGSEDSSSEKLNGRIDLLSNSNPFSQRDSNDGLEDAIVDSLEDNSDDSSKVKGNFDERKVVSRTERVNVRDKTPENNTRMHLSETVNHKDDTTDTEGKTSSPVVLFLGNEPGESDDTSGNIYEEESFHVHLEEDKPEFLQFSLMDWIIPPPPGSTEELLDSEITVASPPPSSPSAISSPTVELSDNMFNEFEIDGLILPPPPLGSSLNSIIKIVSPPPMHLKRSIGEEIPEHNVVDSVHSSTKMLNHLTLDDDELFPVGQAKNKTVPSSESSASSLAMDFDSDSTYYNNGSMISFYSLSNDSQMTSEDENFHDEKEASFGQIRNQNVENLEQNLSITSTEPRRTFEKPQKESQEDDDVYDAEDKTVKEFPEHARRNGGGPYHGNDYDFLDDLVAHSSDDNTSTLKDAKATRRRVQDKTNRNVRKQPRKDVSSTKTSYDDVDDLPRESEESDHEKKVIKSGAVRLPLSHPSHAASFTTTQRPTGSTKGDVRSRVNRFNKTGKPRNPVEPVQTDTTSRTFLSLIDVLKSTDIDNPEEFVGEADSGTSNDGTISHPNRTKHGNSDSNSSKLSPINIRTEPSDASAFSLPGHRKELNPSSNVDDVSMDNQSSEFDSKKDEERTPRLTRKLQIKSNKNRTSSLPNDEKTINTEYVRGDDMSSPNDPESARFNSGDKTMAIGNTDFGSAVPEGDDSVPKSFYAAKTGITDLTDRLKLRLQGCFDDCQDAILNSSPYSPYSNTSNTNWKDGVLNNARFFSSDIKTLNMNVQEMNGDVETAMLSSQETLSSLVSSFVLASSTQYRISLYSMRILAGILGDVISQYDNIVSKIEEVARDAPDKSKCKSVAKETVAMTTLISSLSRTLKRL